MTQWMGMFINHRPFESMNWFTVNCWYWNRLYRESRAYCFLSLPFRSHAETDAEYLANYSENPVGYFGFAARTPNQKGLQFGLDFGLLHTGGPVISGIDASKVTAIKDLSCSYNRVFIKPFRFYFRYGSLTQSVSISI